MQQITVTGDPHYAAEKLSLAVYALAIGAGPIKERLHAAFMEFHPVMERDLPEELRKDFRWIRTELTKRQTRARAVINGELKVGFEGRIGATLHTMRIAKAISIAERICALSDRLTEAISAAA